MGLRNFFRSKGSGLKPDPQLRWFGKLPTYADYYRTQGDEAWTVELTDWMLKGFELYCGRQSGEGHRPVRLTNAVCLLRLPESKMTALAAFFDFGGDTRGRPFPMCFYVGVPTEQYPGPSLNGLAGALKVLGDLRELRRDVELFTASNSSIDDVFGSRVFDLSILDANSDANSKSADIWAGADQIQWSDWFERIKPMLRVKETTSWLDLVESFGANLIERESGAFEPTVGFPIADRTPFEIQVVGWIRWLGHRLDLSRRSLSLIVSGDLDQGPGSLTVVTHDLIPEDFLLMTSQESSLSYLDSLRRVGTSDDQPVTGEPENAAGDAVEDTVRKQIGWREFMDTPPQAP